MNIALRKPMSLAEFLDWERRQELRYEFDGVQPVAMTGGTYAHDLITFNVRQALAARLKGRPCRPCGPNMKVLVAGRARYPDVFVACSPVDPGAYVVNGPVVVFEVVSEDTARTDRLEKLREYQATPSIQQYVVLEQKSIGATVFTRKGEEWVASSLMEGDTLVMPEIGIEIPMAESYEGLSFPDTQVPNA